MKHLYFPFFLLVFLLSGTASAQQLDALSLNKGLKLSGSINTSSIAYTTAGQESRREPFTYFVTGNLNVDLFGYSAPFSFSYTKSQANYTQPFNQFAFAPQYKWAKAYIGSSSMSFSNYTLAGHQFIGGGLELTPGKWSFAGMYGQLKKAVTPDFLNPLQGEPAYARTGYGFKAGYERDGDAVSMNIFRAKDDKTSLDFVPPDAHISAMENTAISISGRKAFLKRFFIETEYAFSVMTDLGQTDAAVDTESAADDHNLLGGLFKNKGTTRNYDAINAGFGYQADWYGIRLGYERVAPNYQTLGAYYFNNDLRNMTVAPTVRLLQGTLNMAGNVGIQHNNLDGAKDASTKRFVGAANATWTPSEVWNVSGGYSNFSTYTRNRPIIDPTFENELDMLNFYQVSQTFNGATGYNFGTKERRQGLMFSASYQKADENANDSGDNTLSDFYTGNLAYTYSIAQKDLSMSASLNYNKSQVGGIETLFIGPNVNVSKAFFQKSLRSTFSTGYSGSTVKVLDESLARAAGNTSVLTARMGLTYSPKKGKDKTGGHNIGLNVNYVQRMASGGLKGFNELTNTLNYSYSF